MAIVLDDYDKAILRELQEDASISNLNLSSLNSGGRRINITVLY